MGLGDDAWAAAEANRIVAGETRAWLWQMVRVMVCLEQASDCERKEAMLGGLSGLTADL